MANNDYLLPAIFIIVFLIGGCLALWRLFKERENAARCPNCGKLWAAEKLGDELIGIFRKGEELGDPDNPEFRMVLYEKFRIHYKCKYCGYEWTILRSRKQ
jgi:predicted RNA-binding Zn-ribbon protein involved in translation (DUF1610 family)